MLSWEFPVSSSGAVLTVLLHFQQSSSIWRSRVSMAVLLTSVQMGIFCPTSHFLMVGEMMVWDGSIYQNTPEKHLKALWCIFCPRKVLKEWHRPLFSCFQGSTNPNAGGNHISPVAMASVFHWVWCAMTRASTTAGMAATWKRTWLLGAKGQPVMFNAQWTSGLCYANMKPPRLNTMQHIILKRSLIF